MGKNRFCLALIACAVMLPAGAQAQQVAGEVLWLSGDVVRIDAQGAAKALAKGDKLLEGEVVRTGVNSHAQLLMKDQALLALRPESSLRLTSYVYTGRADGSERALLKLLKGGLRSITGAIGQTNKESYKLETDEVLVGIRGTDHETFFVPGAGTYNRVTLGGTYLQSPQGRVDLAPGQIGFAGVSAAPSHLQRTPEFMHVSSQLPMGAPFHDGLIALGMRTLLEQATVPQLPAQAFGENAAAFGENAAIRGYGRGGRCAGPCNAEVLGGVGRTTGKGPGGI